MSLEISRMMEAPAIDAQMAATGERSRSSPAAAASRWRLRHGLGGLYLVGMAVVVAVGITTLDAGERADFFVERGIVETLQWLHLAVAGLLLGAMAIAGVRARRPEGWFLVLFASGTFWALNRESDFFWRYHDALGTYKLLKVLIALPGLAVLIVFLRPLTEAWWRARFNPLFMFLYIAIGGYAFAQLVSTGEDALGIARYIRRTSEESLELFAGVFFVLAAIEAAACPGWLDRSSPEPSEIGRR